MNQPLSCRVERSFPVAVVHLAGSMNLTNAPQASAAIRACLVRHPTAVVIDVTELATMTVLAMAMIAAVTRRARDWPGVKIMISGLNGPARGILDGLRGTAVAGNLHVYPDLASALAAAGDQPHPPQRVARLQPVLDAPRQARAIVRDACLRWGIAEDRTGTAELVASELVSNAVVHARTPFDFAVRLLDGVLCLSVRDAVRTSVRRPRVAESGEHGRGLLLIQALAGRWGRVNVPGGKVVWACLPINDHAVHPTTVG